MTTALEGGEWSAACPGHTLPWGKNIKGKQNEQVTKTKYESDIHLPERNIKVS
jgi:hypothetical protein